MHERTTPNLIALNEARGPGPAPRGDHDSPVREPAGGRDPGRGPWPLPVLGKEDGRRHQPGDWPTRNTKADRGPGTGTGHSSLAALRRREHERLGGFSETSKMPWLSWSIPANRCEVGSRLWDVSGSVCEGCYARTRNYLRPSVQRAMERRYEKLADLPAWTDDMVLCLRERAARFEPRPCDPWPAFRWHDSGDIQSAEHLEAICQVAERTQGVPLADGTVSDIRYWLPTREYGHVTAVLDRRTSFPKNLAVRLSAHMIDGPVPAGHGLLVSSVHTRSDVYLKALVCPASIRGGGCGACRACWDANMPHVSYPVH